MFRKLIDSLIIRIVLLLILGSTITVYATRSTVISIFEKSLQHQVDEHLTAYTDIISGAIRTDGRKFIIDKNNPVLKSIPRHWQIDTPTEHLARSYLQKEWIELPKEIHLTPVRFIYDGALGEEIIAIRQELKYPNGEILLITFGLEKKIADHYKQSLASKFKKDIQKALMLLSLIFIITCTIILIVLYLPLRRVSKSLASVRNGNETKITGNYPTEIANLSDQINQLIEYTSNVIERHKTFSANLSHALKTPLTAIKNETDSDAIKEKISVMLQIIERNLARANTAASLNILTPKTNAKATLQRISDSFGKVYNKTIHLNCPQNITLSIDESDLFEIAGNIVENACKHANHTIHINVQNNSITIEDDGPGIPENKYKTILKRGISLDQSKPGQGIGLAITNDIINLYGGTLKLSRSELGGLKVHIEF